MTNSRDSQSRLHLSGQIGFAVLALILFAACGVTWLSAESGQNETMSFVPTEPAHTSQAGDDRPHVASAPKNDLVRVQSAAAGQAFAIIVRFRNTPELDEIARSFRKDPEGARARFSRWAAGKPALSGLRLERASYSGELVLASSGGRDVDRVIAAIKAMDNVAYVEKDYSVQPGKEG